MKDEYSVFNIDEGLLERAKNYTTVFAIGVDTYDSQRLAYCLSRKTNDSIEIILFKSMSNDEEFWDEVNNLSKYFNAEILK